MNADQLAMQYGDFLYLHRALAESPQLRAFYEAERPRITVPIRWEAAPAALRASGLSALVSIAPGYARIQLACLPALAEDAELIAHEMTHLRLWLEGFPRVKKRAGVNPPLLVETTLAGLFEEALVNENLQAYGFNPLASSVYPPSFWRAAAAEPPNFCNHMTAVFWALGLITHMLSYQRLTGIARLDGAFEEIAAAVPQMGRIARRIARRIDLHGWSTPAQQKSLLAWIIATFALQQSFYVVA